MLAFAVCGSWDLCSITFGAFQAVCMLSTFHEKRSSSVEAASGITFVRVF
jgi:hypothetical protein